MRDSSNQRLGRFVHRCTRSLVDLHQDEEGTTLTEFIITLPVMIIVFSGILLLGDLSRESVAMMGSAGVDMFDQIMERQQSSSNSDLLDEMGDDAAHLSPLPAAHDAMKQLDEHAPRQESFAKAAVYGAEMRTYFMGDTLATHGHWGESYGRLWPLAELGKEPPGLEGIVSPETPLLFGQGSSSSRLARDLVFDGYDYDFGLGDCPSALGTVGGAVNELIGSAGARPMLAAGVRYGTVTGTSESTVDYPSGRRSFEVAFNATVTPHVFEDQWIQPALAVAVTRFALENCTLAPYTGLLGVTQQPGLPSSSNPNTQLGVPEPKDTFAAPFEYTDEEQ